MLHTANRLLAQHS